MTHPDRSHLEKVVPGPEYPVVRRGPVQTADTIAAVLIIVVAVFIIVTAASRGAPEHSSSQSPAEPAGAWRDGTAQALLGTPLADERTSGSRSAASEVPGGVPPAADRYRGTATWYCLSGSSACTAGYDGSDLVAAIDTDLGFDKGDRVTVRYRGKAVTVRIVDVCGCPGDRLIDLSSGAFRRLAPLGHGVLPVTVELAGPDSTLPPTDSASGSGIGGVRDERS